MTTHIAANIFIFGQQIAEKEENKRNKYMEEISSVVHTLLSR